MDEIEEKLFGLFRVFRVDAERQMNEFEQVGLLAGDLEMAIVGAVWIMDIGKKRLVRVGGKQIQLSACWMDGCLIDADGSLPLQDELNAGKGRNRGITFPRLVTDDEVGAFQTDSRFAQAVLDNQICFVHRLSVLLQWLSMISRIVLCIAHLQPAGNYNHYSIIGNCETSSQS